jgi:hypothetical protein
MMVGLVIGVIRGPRTGPVGPGVGHFVGERDRGTDERVEVGAA